MENLIDEYDKQEIETNVRKIAKLYDINAHYLPLFIETFSNLIEGYCLKVLNNHLKHDLQWMRDNWDDDDNNDDDNEDIKSPTSPYAEYSDRL